MSVSWLVTAAGRSSTPSWPVRCWCREGTVVGRGDRAQLVATASASAGPAGSAAPVVDGPAAGRPDLPAIGRDSGICTFSRGDRFMTSAAQICVFWPYGDQPCGPAVHRVLLAADARTGKKPNRSVT